MKIKGFDDNFDMENVIITNLFLYLVHNYVIALCDHKKPIS